MVNRKNKVHNFASSLFLLLLIITRSGRLAEIRWSICLSKSNRSLFLILLERCWVVHIPFVRMVKLKFLAQFLVDHLAHQVMSSLIHLRCKFVVFAFMWLMVLSQSPHNPHLLFCCILSIHALIWLVLMALFWAAIKRDSVSLLRFPFLSHVQVFSCEMLLISQ